MGELGSLRSWLWSDPEVRRSTVVEMRGRAPAPGEMGSALDVLEFVTGTGGVRRRSCWRWRRGGRPARGGRGWRSAVGIR
ncbi:hypothetical protein [Streptomyces sp. NPDC090057]|uniref:effector-associated constant component EACC1 n=1 Tax=Streptomyces sp. NPDC090057 TaxID=3365935 RepID=UPI0037FA62C9